MEKLKFINETILEINSIKTDSNNLEVTFKNKSVTELETVFDNKNFRSELQVLSESDEVIAILKGYTGSCVTYFIEKNKTVDETTNEIADIITVSIPKVDDTEQKIDAMQLQIDELMKLLNK